MRLTRGLQLVRSPQERHQLGRAESKHLPVKSPSPEEIQFYYQRLDALTELFHDSPLTSYLEGGYVLPLHLGRFLRQHADIDVGVFQDELESLSQFLRERGYNLFYRNYYLAPLENTPYDLFEQTTIDDVLRRPVRRLYAMKVKKGGRIDEDETVLREIDLHVHLRNGDYTITSKEGYHLPNEWFQETGLY